MKTMYITPATDFVALELTNLMQDYSVGGNNPLEMGEDGEAYNAM